jgi:hypothetical protein
MIRFDCLTLTFLSNYYPIVKEPQEQTYRLRRLTASSITNGAWRHTGVHTYIEVHQLRTTSRTVIRLATSWCSVDSNFRALVKLQFDFYKEIKSLTVPSILQAHPC